MTAVSETHVRRVSAWKVARLVPMIESSRHGRIAAMVIMTSVHVLLYYWLWNAVYARQTSTAGLDVRQTVTYSTLAILCSRIRWTARGYSRDSIPNRLREGTIVYWFVRPLEPRRFYLIRATGEMAFGAFWAALGAIVAMMVGVADPPRSLPVAAVALVSIVLGQAVLYLLGLVVDLVCFWLVANDSVTHIYGFMQDLLSGVFVPLWFFPGWLAGLAGLLPFQAAIHVPLSIYVGRIPMSEVTGRLAVQIGWVAALVVLTRLMWRRAAERVTVHGG
jgi:ABC-2 type transport system permease protein